MAKKKAVKQRAPLTEEEAASVLSRRMENMRKLMEKLDAGVKVLEETGCKDTPVYFTMMKNLETVKKKMEDSS